MPSIAEYQSHADLSPLSSGDAPGEIASGLYKGLASGLHDAGEAIQRYQEQQESSKFAVAHSALTAQATNAWEDIKKNQDASDPDVRQKFLESYNDQVDSLSNDISSSSVRAHAAEVIASTKAHFATATLADMAQASGAKAVERIGDIKNNGAASAYNDPSFFDSAGNVTGMYVAASGLPQNEVPKATLAINKEIAKSTIDGMLDRGDIVNARKDIESGRFDKALDGTEKSALLRHVQEFERAQTVAANAAREQKVRDEKELSDNTHNDYLTKLADPKNNPAQWAHDVLTDPNMKPEAKDSAIRLLGTLNEQRQRAVTEAHTAVERADADGDKLAANAVMARINAPPGDPNRITDPKDIYAEVQVGGLTVARANTLVTSLNAVKASELKKDGFAAQYAEFHRAARADITRGLQSKEGDYADFISYAEPLIQRGLAAGKTAGQLFDKESPDYVGKGYKAPLNSASQFEDKGKKAVPTIGTIEGGFKFLGGDPSKQSSWQAVSKVPEVPARR